MVVLISHNDVSPVVHSDTCWPVQQAHVAAQPSEFVGENPLAGENLYAVVGPVRYYDVTLVIENT